MKVNVKKNNKDIKNIMSQYLNQWCADTVSYCRDGQIYTNLTHSENYQNLTYRRCNSQTS